MNHFLSIEIEFISFIEQTISHEWFIHLWIQSFIFQQRIVSFDELHVIILYLLEIKDIVFQIVIQIWKLEIIEFEQTFIDMFKKKSWKIYFCHFFDNCNSQSVSQCSFSHRSIQPKNKKELYMCYIKYNESHSFCQIFCVFYILRKVKVMDKV